MTTTTPPTPALLRLGQPLALLGAVLAALSAIALVRGSPYDTSALETLSPYGLWSLRVLVALTLWAAAILYLIYRGLKQRQCWVRPVIVAFWALCQAGALVLMALGPASEGSWSADLTPTVFLVGSIVYLYFKPNVAAYFAAIQRPKRPNGVA